MFNPKAFKSLIPTAAVLAGSLGVNLFTVSPAHAGLSTVLDTVTGTLSDIDPTKPGSSDI